MITSIVWVLLAASTGKAEGAALVPTGFIELPAHRGAGGFDHADVLPSPHRLYVAHTANDSVEIVDLDKGRLLNTVTGLKGVAGVLVGSDQVFTSNRGEDTVSVLSPDGEIKARIPVEGRPNGLAFDPKRGLLLVAGTAPPYAVTTVDVKKRAVVGRVAVPGRTRWAAYDPAQSLFFVNVADPPSIIAVDPARPNAIARRYDVPVAGPHGLALDSKTGTLLVACDGKSVVSLDTKTGKVVAQAPISGAPDAIFLDEARRRLYVAIGSPGAIDVLDVDRLSRVGSVPTEAGAHTMALDSTNGRAFALLPKTHRAAVFTIAASAATPTAK